jgi:hypothetical protein
MTTDATLPEAILPTELVTRGRAADQQFLRAAATFDSKRLGAYSVAREYYDGDQGAQVGERLKAFLEVNNVPYAENFCETVVDALAERLAVAGFTTEQADNETNTDELADWIQGRVWDANELDAEQVRIHDETTKLGDAFAIVDWDPERQIPRVVYNPPDVVQLVYDTLGRPRYGVKVWNSDVVTPTNPSGRAIKRMNLYYPDRVEKWFSLTEGGESSWWPHLDVDDGTTWPISWETKARTPRGIPVFHFANKPRGDHYGRAEHRGTIPQQNRLNKELLDLSAILDTMGWPRTYSTGTKTGTALKTAPGEHWESDNENAKFGQFDAADPSGPLASIGKTLERIAGRSRTPMHMLLADQEAPSGESRKTAEAGLVKKVGHRQVFHGQTWISLMRMAMIVAAEEATEAEAKPPVDAAVAAIVKINVRWADPEPRNEKEHLESLALMHELGVSTETILGMIPGIDAAEEVKRRAKEDADAAERLMATLAAGGSANPPEDGQRGPQPPPPGARRPARTPTAR